MTTTSPGGTDDAAAEPAADRVPHRGIELAIIAVVVLASLAIYSLMDHTADADASDAPPATTGSTAPEPSTDPTVTTEPATGDTSTAEISASEPDTTEPAANQSASDGSTSSTSLADAPADTVAPSPTAPTAPTAPTVPRPLPSKVAWIDVTAGAPVDDQVAECRAGQRSVFEALERHAERTGVVPAEPDLLDGADSWSATWAFVAIGDATVVVPVPGGTCDH